MVSARLKWLDIAKGLGILLMVLGHSSVPVVVAKFIWAFHMPLFFIASGWTTNWEKGRYRRFFQRKIPNPFSALYILFASGTNNIYTSRMG